MNLANKTVSGVLWVALGEVIVKCISPISFLVLTHILLPEDFGIVAVATTVLMFVSIIADLGTGKVLVQIKCDDTKEFERYCNTAFVFNSIMGLVLFLCVFFLSPYYAELNNQPRSESVIRLMSTQILFSSLSIVQISIKNREMNYKSLFFIRLITVMTPVVISIPIALCGGGLWAIVIGSVCSSFFQLVVLWCNTSWKPQLQFHYKVFHNLFSKSIWSTVQQIAVWIPIYFDTYLISNHLSASSLGLYTASRSLFTSASGIILAPFLPVLFSSLSKIHENSKLKQVTLLSQKIVFYMSSLVAIIVFCYSDVITKVIFSNKWDGISPVLQIVFLLMGLEYFYSIIVESLRSRGLFKQLGINNLLSVLVTVPFLYFASYQNIIVYTMIRCLSLYVCYWGVFHYSKKYLNISFSTCIGNVKNILIVIFIHLFLYYVLVKLNASEVLSYSFLVLLTMLSLLWIYIKEKELVSFVRNCIVKVSFSPKQ